MCFARLDCATESVYPCSGKRKFNGYLDDEWNLRALGPVRNTGPGVPSPIAAADCTGFPQGDCALEASRLSGVGQVGARVLGSLSPPPFFSPG